jgi:hypothetical protein
MFLLAESQKVQEDCSRLIATAEQRGLVEKKNGIKATVDKLKGQSQAAAAALTDLSVSREP